MIMPFKNEKKRRDYMKKYMRNYRKQERKLIHKAKQHLGIPQDRRKIKAKTLGDFGVS